MQDLLFETPTQYAVLALMLVAGWLFGFASAPGGRKWKRLYRKGEAANARLRDTHEHEMREANARIHALEAERDEAHRKLAAAGAVGAAGASAASMESLINDEDRTSGSRWRGWFGWGRDNLSRIDGIDEVCERRLNGHGIKAYREVEALTAEDAADLEDRLGLKRGTIAEQDWREQARMLRDGEEGANGARFD